MSKAKIIKEWIGKRGGKRAILECLYCGNKFEVGGWRFNRNPICCSKSCANKHNAKKGENNPKWKGGEIKRVCKECGKTFMVKSCKIKFGRGIYCSKSCSGKANTKGDKNYFWNGGKTINSGGYIEIKINSHPYATQRGYIREHRLIVEQYLKKNDPKNKWLHKIGDNLYLNKKVEIHHIDKNKKNNDLMNLYVFGSTKEHCKYHQKIIKYKIKDILKTNINIIKIS